jgi:hypothetical protein
VARTWKDEAYPFLYKEWNITSSKDLENLVVFPHLSTHLRILNLQLHFDISSAEAEMITASLHAIEKYWCQLQGFRVFRYTPDMNPLHLEIISYVLTTSPLLEWLTFHDSQLSTGVFQRILSDAGNVAGLNMSYSSLPLGHDKSPLPLPVQPIPLLSLSTLILTDELAMAFLPLLSQLSNHLSELEIHLFSDEWDIAASRSWIDAVCNLDSLVLIAYNGTPNLPLDTAYPYLKRLELHEVFQDEFEEFLIQAPQRRRNRGISWFIDFISANDMPQIECLTITVTDYPTRDEWSSLADALQRFVNLQLVRVQYGFHVSAHALELNELHTAKALSTISASLFEVCSIEEGSYP